MVENSKEWFGGKLSKTNVETMFRSSIYCPRGDINDPFIIRINGSESLEIPEKNNINYISIIHIIGLAIEPNRKIASLSMKIVNMKKVVGEKISVDSKTINNNNNFDDKLSTIISRTVVNTAPAVVAEEDIANIKDAEEVIAVQNVEKVEKVEKVEEKPPDIKNIREQIMNALFENDFQKIKDLTKNI
jgi:hypothetical protein